MSNGATLLALLFTLVALGFTVFRGVKTARGNSNHTFTSFFLTNRAISDSEIASTLAATNTALALIVFWFSYLAWLYGAGVVIWLFLYWVFGLEVFAILQRRWCSFPDSNVHGEPEHQTLHDYVSAAVDGNWARRSLALVSILTFVLMMTVELTRGIRVFDATPLGKHPAVLDIVALIVLLGAAVYAAWGGLHAVIKTDFWQWIISAIALLTAGAIALPEIWSKPGLFGTVFAPTGPSIRSVILLPDQWFFVVGSLFSWSLWFVVTMDMWQRAAAARRIQLVTLRTRLILYPWFAILTIASVSIGLYVRTVQPQNFQETFPAVTFLVLAFERVSSDSLFASIPIALVFAGFVTAMISTLDTYLVTVAHSVLRDLPDSQTRTALRDGRFSRFLPAVVTVGIALAVYPTYLVIAHSDFSINALLYLATSSPFILAPPILLAAGRKKCAKEALISSVIFGLIVCAGSIGFILDRIASADPGDVGIWYNWMYFVPFFSAIGSLVGYGFGSFLGTLTARR